MDQEDKEQGQPPRHKKENITKKNKNKKIHMTHAQNKQYNRKNRKSRLGREQYSLNMSGRFY